MFGAGFPRSVPSIYVAKERVDQVPGGGILQKLSRKRRVTKVALVGTCQRLRGGGEPFPNSITDSE